MYLQLAQKTINFYTQDEEYNDLTGLDKFFLDEVNLQKERMQMEIKESKQRQKNQLKINGHG